MARNLRIDPHVHSAMSDGTDAPAEIMHIARAAGLDMIALTDHDTTIGWEEAAGEVSASGVALIRGTEISCSVDGYSVHLLAYLFEPEHTGLKSAFKRSRDSRVTRMERMVDNLSADFPITYEDVLRHAEGSVTVGRPHIADALVEVGAFDNRSAAFEKVLHPSSPYYVFHWAIDPSEAVALVRDAGGVPVLAHPRASKRQRVLPEHYIDDMAQAGLFGIERNHRDHDDAARADVDRIAARLGLEVFGSSDYHGHGKPNAIGENLTSEHIIRSVEEQGRLELLRP